MSKMKRYRLDPNSKEMKEYSRGTWVKFNEANYIRKYLLSLTINVRKYLKALDAIMKEESTFERGKKIAQISNILDMANDRARYFGLNIDYRKDKK